MFDKPEDDLPINAVMILEFPPEPHKLQTEALTDAAALSDVDLESNQPNHAGGGLASGIRSYFDVSTEEVLGRVLRAAVPDLRCTFYISRIKSRPDLCGPLWIGVTLALLLGLVSGLMASSRSVEGRKYSLWSGLHCISNALFLVFAYSLLVPVGLWTWLRWNRVAHFSVPLAEVVCVYGYSIVIYILAVSLMLLKNTLLNYATMITASAISSYDALSLVLPLVSRKRETAVLGVLCTNVIFTLLLYIIFLRK